MHTVYIAKISHCLENICFFNTNNNLEIKFLNILILALNLVPDVAGHICPNSRYLNQSFNYVL